MGRLEKKIKVTTTIELITGLHIGGNDANIEIGGIDNQVIKLATRKNQPYIPGSSLKGKLRCLLEQLYGISEVGGGNGNYDSKSEDCKNIIALFGYANDNKPSRLIVRDSYLTQESAIMLEEAKDSLDMLYTENKYENSINRISGKATNPRQTERVPAGVMFDVEFIINKWEGDDENKLKSLLKEGIRAIENDYLGGNGSRGYGQVKFGELKFEDITFGNV